MSSTMKALVYIAPGKMELQSLPVPHPAEDEVLIRVKRCGICGSDVQGFLGRTGRRIAPMVMGHEFSGVIEAVGGAVTALHIGQRVTAQPIRYCGKCAFCLQGKTSLCSKQSMLGVLSTNGAMAQYVLVAERQVIALPDDVDYDTAALAEPFAVAYSAVSKVDVAKRDVAVVGTGTIGLMLIAALRLKGARRIYAMDLEYAKRAFALAMGADEAFDPRDACSFERMLDATGGGVDVSFEAVGVDASVNTAISSLKKAGVSVWVGNMLPEIRLNMQQIVTRELQIRGNFDYTQQSFADTVANMGRFDFSQLIGKRTSLEDAAELFQRIADGEIDGIKTMIDVEG